jgi:hypothetical protein
MTPWGAEPPSAPMDVTVIVNDDAHGRCWADGCRMTGDLVVTLHGDDIERAAICCTAEHWLPVRRMLMNRGHRIEYGAGAAELIMARLAPRALLRRGNGSRA